MIRKIRQLLMYKEESLQRANKRIEVLEDEVMNLKKKYETNRDRYDELRSDIGTINDHLFELNRCNTDAQTKVIEVAKDLEQFKETIKKKKKI